MGATLHKNFDVERAWMEARNKSAGTTSGLPSRLCRQVETTSAPTGCTSSGLPGSQANPLAETTSLPTGGTNSVLPSPQPNPCTGTTSLPTGGYIEPAIHYCIKKMNYLMSILNLLTYC
ncbi:uncharacterized protein [Montipora capricornis]|uniref:uncharacterized protein n=1 Tax=Montipora capricornis TaxID=246305 RepID=UPI0035F14EA9